MRCDRPELEHLAVDFLHVFDLTLALFHKFTSEPVDLLPCILLNFAFILLQNVDLLTLKRVHILKSFDERFLLIDLYVIIFRLSIEQIV